MGVPVHGDIGGMTEAKLTVTLSNRIIELLAAKLCPKSPTSEGWEARVGLRVATEAESVLRTRHGGTGNRYRAESRGLIVQLGNSINLLPPKAPPDTPKPLKPPLSPMKPSCTLLTLMMTLTLTKPFSNPFVRWGRGTP
jgi:hypothetical protein